MSKAIIKNKNILILLLLSSAYFFTLFHRYSLAVLAINIIDEVPFVQDKLGLIGSAYFYCYAPMLFFSGIIVDYFSSRFSLKIGLFLLTVGCLIFSRASSLTLFLVSRGIIGLGSALITIPSIKLIRETFQEKKFGMVIGINNTLGYIGVIMASFPLAFLLSYLSWRTTHLLISIITGLLTIISLILLPHQRTEIHKEKKAMMLNKIYTLMKIPRLWMLSFWMLTFTGTKLAFQALWAGPYFVKVYGITYFPIILLIISVGSTAGSLIMGCISDLSSNRRKILIYASLFIFSLWFFLYIYPDKLSTPITISFYFILGISFASYLLALMEVRDICKLENTGFVVGIISSIGFFGSALFTQIGNVFYQSGEGGIDTTGIFQFKNMFLLNFIIILFIFMALILYEIWLKFRTKGLNKIFNPERLTF
ncbi:MAG: MFS transporter [bacterium]